MRSMSWDELISAVVSQGANAYDAPPFSTVTENLSLIDKGGPEQLSTDSLHSDLEWFASVQRSLDALSARWLAELDRRQHEDDDPDPAGPCVQWLHERLHLTPNAAYAQLSLARLLELLPRCAAARSAPSSRGSSPAPWSTSRRPAWTLPSWMRRCSTASGAWTPSSCSGTGRGCATRPTRRPGWRPRRSSAGAAGYACARPGAAVTAWRASWTP